MDPETLLLFNRATTLQERIRAFSQGIGEGRQTHARDSAAVIRIWKEKLGNKTDALQKRSEWAGFRVEDVEDILCTSPIKEGDLPFWATELASLLEFSRANTDTAHREMRPQRSDRIFPEVFALFEAYAQRTLKEHLANHGLAIDTLLGLEAQNNVFDSLLSRLASVAEGPLYFEFDNSRSAGLRLMAGAYTHADDPPADEAKFGTRYYDEFLQRLLETALYSLFSVYPVLGRLIGTILAQWREATVIWLIRLANDRERLEKINELAPGTLGLVKAAVLDLSDFHRSGKSVICLTFDEARIVYKPKDIGLEHDLYSFLEYLTVPSGISSYQVICGEGYGWVCCVKRSDCRNESELHAFYENCGSLLAVLNVLRATDCHYENIIACGAYPTLIDAETLLHPEVRLPAGIAELRRGAQKFFDSVVRVGALPYWQFNADMTTAYDISSLGYSTSTEAAQSVQTWRFSRSDLMHPVHRERESPLPDCAPALQGKSISYSEYIEDVVKGFRRTYRALERQKDFLSRWDVYRSMRFRNSRFIFRASHVYGVVQLRATQRENLVDGILFSLEQEGLARVFIDSQDKPRAWKLLDAELAQLADLDIPFFEAAANSDDLVLSADSRIANYFRESGFDSSVRTLMSLNEDDLAWQISLIRGTFAARRAHEGLPAAESAAPTPSRKAPDTCLKVAVSIADRLASSAFWSDKHCCSWSGISMVASAGRFQLRPAGYNLYDGSAGIGLFLAAMSWYSGDVRYAHVAAASMDEIRRILRSPSPGLTMRVVRELGAGAGSGIGSIAYALCRIGILLDKPAFVADAIVACKYLEAYAPEDTDFDVMGGVAGGAVAALAVYSVTGSAQALGAAKMCGERLLSLADRLAHSNPLLWRLSPKVPPIGFAHGLSGIAFAATRLALTTSDDRFHALAESALGCEDALLKEVTSGSMALQNLSWCNGATGIALARLRIQQLNRQLVPPQEVWSAHARIGSSAFDGPDHVCCGQFGRLNFLHEVNGASGGGPNINVALRRTSLLEKMKRSDDFDLHQCVRDNDFFPGFFQGTSGIGYELLRLYEPGRLPNVLAFD